MTVDISSREKFGKFLKMLLVDKNIKQKEVAELIDTTPQYINRVITGKAAFVADQINLIHDFLKSQKVSENNLDKLIGLFFDSRMDFGKIKKLGFKKNNPMLDMLIEQIEDFSKDEYKLLLKSVQQIKIDRLG